MSTPTSTPTSATDASADSPADATATAASVDAPLPLEITGRAQGWFWGYRRYPVFSRPWVRGRVRSTGLLLAVGFALLLLGLVLSPPSDSPLGGITQLVLNFTLPLFLGPWLGSLVRRQGWAPTREFRALVAVMATMVLVLLAFNQWGAEPLKQWIAEQTGAVDASGKRKRVVVALGVQINSPAAIASSPPGTPPPSTLRDPDNEPLGSVLVGKATSAFVTFWLAGGFGLWGWRRERRDLAWLAQERALARAQAERREAELRLSVLAAQVEPHFLFNTLAGVRSAIATDPGRAADMVDRLVDYLRATIPRLRSDGSAEATLGTQLDSVRAYLGLMAARMPRLSFAVEAPATLLGARCPPLMLISLVENAVKHGIELKIGAARIEVTARATDDGRLEITVADDGVGFGVSPAGTGLGLTNIRERLQQLYRDRASLTLKARPDGGVTAIIAFPLEQPT